MNANYHVFQIPGFVCLIDRDCDGCRSVTNDVERIIDEDLSLLLAVPGVRLIYRDSQGRWDEVLLKRREHVGSFDGFAPIRDDKLAETIDVLTPAFFGDPTDDDLLAMGYERPFKVLDDGRIAALQTINTWLIALAVGIYGHGHEDAYYYRSRDDAKRALDDWTSKGEPQGWIRHPQSGRRREDGDPAREYIQP
ncbi:hypothetical protein [Caballeronia cordobensis]|uniref:hypothetical protein n=1 Tax=Caballeronia cordobensis TaxID=1353886 RepID=UPI00045EF705|nr:uncharacterized protein BRPE67_CCDS10550 [Burkholderia sp. RPE67]